MKRREECQQSYRMSGLECYIVSIGFNQARSFKSERGVLKVIQEWHRSAGYVDLSITIVSGESDAA